MNKKSELIDWEDVRNESLQDNEIKELYNKLPPIEIASEILKIRYKKGLTQEEFAKMIGIKQPALARLENPNYKGYSIRTLHKIANALGATLEIKFKYNH